MRMIPRGYWDTDELKQLEFVCIKLTYVQAFLHLTVNEEMPFRAAIEWLHFLAGKWPESRLAVHIKATDNVYEQLVG